MSSKEKFYHPLTDRKEYKYVPKVWNKFKMKTMKDYHDLHLRCDILLLVDIFEKFGNNILKNYVSVVEFLSFLSHYLSQPSSKWDAMLNMTKVKFKLIPDPACTYSSKKVSSRVSFISNRYTYYGNIGGIWNLMNPKQES